ncbi:MAG: hypothetical protein HQL53_13865 [Magnetococcales bacterium]|nr:hypothetical protein [Magnetococcales bacterium]
MTLRALVFILAVLPLIGCQRSIALTPLAEGGQSLAEQGGRPYVEARKRHLLRLWPADSGDGVHRVRLVLTLQNLGREEIAVDPHQMEARLVVDEQERPVKLVTYRQLLKEQNQVHGVAMLNTGVNEVGAVLYPMVHQIHQNEREGYIRQHEARLADLKNHMLRRQMVLPGVTAMGRLVLALPEGYAWGDVLELTVPFDQERYRFRLRMERMRRWP